MFLVNKSCLYNRLCDLLYRPWNLLMCLEKITMQYSLNPDQKLFLGILFRVQTTRLLMNTSNKPMIIATKGEAFFSYEQCIIIYTIKKMMNLSQQREKALNKKNESIPVQRTMSANHMYIFKEQSLQLAYLAPTYHVYISYMQFRNCCIYVVYM